MCEIECLIQTKGLETACCSDSSAFEDVNDFFLRLNAPCIAYFIEERLVGLENLLQIHLHQRQNGINKLHNEDLEMILRADHVFTPRFGHNNLVPSHFLSLPASRPPANPPTPSPFPSNAPLTTHRSLVRILAAPQTAAH